MARDESHGGFFAAFTFGMFTISFVIMALLLTQHLEDFRFYEVANSEGSQNLFRISLGILRYCVTLSTAGDSCIGPSGKAGWTFEKVGSYLPNNATTHVEELQKSIQFATTIVLGVTNAILFGFAGLGFVLSTILLGLSFYGRNRYYRTKLCLFHVLRVIAPLTFLSSFVAMIVSHTTATAIGNSIKNGTGGALKLRKITKSGQAFTFVKGSSETIYTSPPSGVSLLIGPFIASLFGVLFAFFSSPDKPEQEPDNTDQIALRPRRPV